MLGLGLRSRLGVCFGGLGALAFAGTVGCSYLYDFDYRITIDESVDLVEIGDGPEVVMAIATEDDVAGAHGYLGSQVLETDRRQYRGEAQHCCSPSATVYLFAYIDVNLDGVWSEGEPWGEDPNNPVVIDDDDYVSRIDIGPAL